jgi:outer membrane immunogenic protein
LAAAGPVAAADMPYKAPPPRPLCANFGGFYVGAQAAAARYTNHWSDRDDWDSPIQLLLGNNAVARESTNTKTGFAGGLTAGWNYQARCTVFGVEADYSWSRITADGFHTTPSLGTVLGLTGPDSVTVSSKLDGFGTLRVRSGIVVDNLLVYVTGGLAAARFDRSQTINLPLLALAGGGVFTSNETFTHRDTRWGWTAGVGTELALWGNWSLKSEFLYMGFDRHERTLNSTIGANPVLPILASGPKRFENQDSVWVSRIGINWRWGGGPLYARN